MTPGPAPRLKRSTSARTSGSAFDLRLAVICIAAASTGLSMVAISVAKLLLVICALGILLTMHRQPGAKSPLDGMASPVAILVALFAFGLSLSWTIGPWAEALGSFAKYGKLLMILLMVLAIRDVRDAKFALGTFAVFQCFLLASSWILFAKVPVPWATSRMATTEYSVFSSYLDQGIISAVFAALCWHFRALAPGRYASMLAVFVAFAALANVLFVLSGRSGHVVALALVSLAIMWELPKKYWPVALLVPFVVAFGLFFSSGKVRDRLTQVHAEVQSYSTLTEPGTSSGIRLNLWRRALQTMQQHPVAGTGVGSWSTQFNHLQRQQNPAHVDVDSNGNPHQEYLMWGMQLGVPGLLIFLGLLISLYKDTVAFNKAERRAAQSALAALAVACLFNASIYDAQIGDFFCILLGLLLSFGRHRLGAETAAHPHRASPA